MEECVSPPIFLSYERDPVDDSLHNTSWGDIESHSSSHLHSPFTKSTTCINHCEDLMDENGRQWTNISFRFYFHIYDESHCNRFETILLENHYFHPTLEPRIQFQKEIIDGKSSEWNAKSVIPFPALSEQYLSDRKPMRPEKREILLKYSVSLGAVARPLSQFYRLIPLSITSQSLSDVTMLNELIASQLGDLTSFLSLLLMMAQELNEIHCQGLCHCHLVLDSFLLYSPSSESTCVHSMEWGVQMMAHWMYLPCGPRDSSCIPLRSPSRNMVSDSSLSPWL